MSKTSKTNPPAEKENPGAATNSGAQAPVSSGPIISSEEFAALHEQEQFEETARRFAAGILSNPHAYQYLRGSPLEPHTVEEKQSVGEYLAHRCHAMAVDFERTLEALRKSK